MASLTTATAAASEPRRPEVFIEQAVRLKKGPRQRACSLNSDSTACGGSTVETATPAPETPRPVSVKEIISSLSLPLSKANLRSAWASAATVQLNSPTTASTPSTISTDRPSMTNSLNRFARPKRSCLVRPPKSYKVVYYYERDDKIRFGSEEAVEQLTHRGTLCMDPPRAGRRRRRLSVRFVGVEDSDDHDDDDDEEEEGNAVPYGHTAMEDPPGGPGGEEVEGAAAAH